jgi:hypothetical protein
VSEYEYNLKDIWKKHLGIQGKMFSYLRKTYAGIPLQMIRAFRQQNFTAEPLTCRGKPISEYQSGQLPMN